MSLDLSPILPDKVTVYYPSRRCKGDPDVDDIPLWFKIEHKLEDIEFSDPDVSENKFKGVPTTLIIHDTCQSLAKPGGDPDNGDALTDLAEQIAQDFYDFRSFSMDLTYLGMYQIIPTALFDYIEFIYDADKPDEDDDRIEAIEERKRPNCITRILAEPWNGEVQEMQHMDPAIKDCTDKNNDDTPISPVPCIYYYSGEALCIGGGGKAEAVISNGQIIDINVTKPGKYISTPKIAIAGDGTGAKATATLGSGGIDSVSMSDIGKDYTYAFISFNGGGSQLQLTRMMLCLEDGRLVSRFISYDTVG